MICGLCRAPFEVPEDAEEGTGTPMLMARSGSYTSVRSLAKYARVSAEALGLDRTIPRVNMTQPWAAGQARG